MQSKIDQQNSEFWDEICGSHFAKVLGIKDHSLASLALYDNAYFSFYPYLLNHVPVESMRGQKVLEIGLGFGTLGLKIAQSGADYLGLDIAKKPVEMMNQRMKLYKLSGKAIQGNILNCSLPDQSVDCVVAIGCFHHTGNLSKCIDQTYRLLKPKGHAYLMLYNQYSYRRWLKWPREVFKALLHDLGLASTTVNITQDQKAACDTNQEGTAAPETVFSSISQLKNTFARFSSVSFSKENCDEPTQWPFRKFLNRKSLLPNLGKLFGLDIYIHAKK